MNRVVGPLVLVLSTFASAMLPALAQEPHVARYELKLSELKYGTPLAATTVLTTGSKTNIQDSATGGTFVFTAAAGNTQQEVPAAAQIHGQVGQGPPHDCLMRWLDARIAQRPG